MKYITQDEAIQASFQIDQVLMDPSSPSSYTLSQLMELAGLACATALERCYPKDRYRRVMIVCGPGNQGGDGLVAARHLGIWGYTVLLHVPKPSKHEYLSRLLLQCRDLASIREIDTAEDFREVYKPEKLDVCMDAIFGFSFKPPVRAPFDTILNLLSSHSRTIPIVSIDIPSGWTVGPPSASTEAGSAGSGKTTSDQSLRNTKGEEVASFSPHVLLSLTAPKEGVRGFEGRHFLGGRFVPPAVAERFGLDLPEYAGSEQIVDITGK